MKVKILSAWVSYVVAKSDHEMYHSSLVIHASMKDAIDYTCAVANKHRDELDYDRYDRDGDGDEIIGASVKSGDDLFLAASIPVEHKT